MMTVSRSPNIFTRRELVRNGVCLAGMLGAVTFVPRVTWAHKPQNSKPTLSIQDSRIQELVQRAIDAAHSAGATYADVRLTYTKQRIQRNTVMGILDGEYLHAGVRALVNGYWGFAASPVWTHDEMVRLGQEAVHQAKVNDLGNPRELSLPSVTKILNGHWETPIKIDGFSVHPLEVTDYLMALNERMRLELSKFEKYGPSTGDYRIQSAIHFVVQEKAFGSTEGSYYTQRIHRSEGEAECSGAGRGASVIDMLTLAGKGWELMTETPIIDAIRQRIEEGIRMAELPVKPVDVGRYDTVFDARSVANLLSQTIGAATEIDRVLGYEANATGTSYLNDPDAMLNTFSLGTSELNVSANRSEAGGVATTGWDDEGVKPNDIVLIENGIVNDFQTSREGAGWLQDVYARKQRPFQSHGFAFSNFGTDVPMIHTGNLVMQPSSESLSQADLEADIKEGMSVVGISPEVDFQCLGGLAKGMECYAIKDGKRVARIAKAGILFRTPELWKDMIAIGGQASSRRYGMGGLLTGGSIVKGEPEQYGYHSVTAVPMTVKDVTFIDTERR